MSSTFQTVNGEALDLNRQDHRDEVIKRNKALEFALKHGIEYPEPRITVTIDVSLNCLKCGDTVFEGIEQNLEELPDDIEEDIPKLTCASCGTKYHYDLSERRFFPKIKKIHKFLKNIKD